MKNKSHFAIIIETPEGKKFGCYIESMIKEVKEHFQELLSSNRIIMICKCLEYRYNKLKELL